MNRQLDSFLQHLRTLLHEGSAVTDAQLLESFIARKDEVAFAALVRRHGPMVWGVCRRALNHVHDAEDAFQATFLVLIRKAASVVPRAMVGNWLYGVAYRTAMKARVASVERRTKERQVEAFPDLEVPQQDLWRDLQPLLDQELDCLPDKYRAALVLCDLEGKTHNEAARQLGWPVGTLSTRLVRGRTMLAKRLARLGLPVSGGALAGVVSQNAALASVPALVMSSTIQAAGVLAAGNAVTAAVVSARVASLCEGVLKAMLLTKLKTQVTMLLVLCMAGASGGLLSYHTAAAQQGPAENSSAVPLKEGGREKTEGAAVKVEYTQPFAIPTADEILKALPKGQPRLKNPRIRCELVAFRLEEPKIFPKVGQAQLSTAHFKCIVKGDQGREVVVYLDKDRLIELRSLPDNVGAGTMTLADYLARPSPKLRHAAATENDLKQLQGKWEAVTVIQSGKALKKDALTRFTIKGDKIIYDATREEQFKIDSTKTPKHFDLIVITDEKEEKIVQGIFEIKGDDLKICLGFGGKGRPKAFESDQDSACRLIILKRVKS